MTIRTFLKEKFRDYMNNYLTVEKLADDNGITTKDAVALLNMGRFYHDADADTETEATK